MKIEKWKYTNVKLDGTLGHGGQIDTKFVVKNSMNNGCTIKGCKCRKCHWISINFGMQENFCVCGLTYYFRTKHEQSNFILSN